MFWGGGMDLLHLIFLAEMRCLLVRVSVQGVNLGLIEVMFSQLQYDTCFTLAARYFSDMA